MPTAFAAIEIELDRFSISIAIRFTISRAPTRRDLVAETRDQMIAQGCCRISDFMRPTAVEAMRQRGAVVARPHLLVDAGPQSLLLRRRRVTSCRPPEADVSAPRERLHQCRPVADRLSAASDLRLGCDVALRVGVPRCAASHLPLGRPARPQPVRRARPGSAFPMALRWQRVHRQPDGSEGRRAVGCSNTCPTFGGPTRRTSSASHRVEPAGTTRCGRLDLDSRRPAVVRGALLDAPRHADRGSNDSLRRATHVRLRSVSHESLLPLDVGLRPRDRAACRARSVVRRRVDGLNARRAARRVHRSREHGWADGAEPVPGGLRSRCLRPRPSETGGDCRLRGTVRCRRQLRCSRRRLRADIAARTGTRLARLPSRSSPRCPQARSGSTSAPTTWTVPRGLVRSPPRTASQS